MAKDEKSASRDNAEVVGTLLTVQAPRWEYLVLRLLTSEILESQLNALGAERWELVGLTRVYLILKRQLP